jgi:hypothetical protein
LTVLAVAIRPSVDTLTIHLVVAKLTLVALSIGPG